MRLERRLGVGKGEILAFIVVLGGAAMAFMYFQKPKVINHTVTVVAPPSTAPVETAPPPPVEQAPPPPPKPEVSDEPTAPPPPPEVVIIEQNLKAAQEALAQSQNDLATAKKAAIENAHNTDDYKNAVLDLSDKQKTRQDSINQLAKDNSVGADTLHDEEAMKSAAQDVVVAKAKLVSLETDAATNDTTAAQKQAVVKADTDKVNELQNRLNNFIAHDIAVNCTVPNCAVKSVTVDTANSTITARIEPEMQRQPGAVTDVAMAQIASILDKTLYKSPFDWMTAKFTVYADYQGKQVPEFQAIFLRNDVDNSSYAKPDGHHYDNKAITVLAHTIWVSRAISGIQGLPAEQPTIIPAASPGVHPLIQYTDTLQIGGYARDDGSFCPVTLVRQSYTKEAPLQFNKPDARVPAPSKSPVANEPPP